MKKTTIFTITGAMLFLFSCSKAEMVSGTYKGTATGSYVGINEPARVELIVYGAHSVELDGRFTGGLHMLFGQVQVTGPENGVYTLSSGSVNGTIENSNIYFHYSITQPYPGFPSNIEFTGRRE